MATSGGTKYRPISEAPVKNGEVFGPCILGPHSHESGVTVGYFNGEYWIDYDGFRFEPLVFILLCSAGDALRGLHALGSDP